MSPTSDEDEEAECSYSLTDRLHFHLPPHRRRHFRRPRI